jgi:hypothetical protein
MKKKVEFPYPFYGLEQSIRLIKPLSSLQSDRMGSKRLEANL